MRLGCIILALLCFVTGFSQEKPSEKPAAPAIDKTRHPLDPLSEDEIKVVSKLLKDEKKATRRALYTYIGLKEPKKDDVLSYKQGDPFERKAKAAFYEPKTNETFEAIVDLNHKSIDSCRVVGKQGPWNDGEQTLTDRILRADPRWIAAIKKRGLDPLDVGIGAGPNRGYVDVKPDGSRYVLAMSFMHDAVDSVELSDLLALVNITKRKVEWIRDGGAKAVRADSDQDAENPEFSEPTRPAPKPLKTTMPEGATFTMEGNLVRWQNWRFRIGYDPRVGMILYTVGWEDADKVRSVMYSANLSELYVPYGDPNYMLVHWFDAGEFGLGTLFNSSFVPMNDAPENAKMISAVVNDSRGRPRTIPNAIALYEKDGGILWRHGGESRRARDLVLASIHQAGNYDYCFQWVFHQDGRIEQEVVLSGFVETKNVDREKDPENLHGSGRGTVGTLVAPNIEATNHQHFFSFRLDLDVDGPVKNQIFECNVESIPAASNALKNGIQMVETPLRTELAAQRDVNMLSHRCWKIVNSAVRNKLNQPSAYMLMPGETAVPYSLPDSYLRKVSGFTEHQFWATPYDPTQMHAAGEYVFDGAPDDGLKQWTAGNRQIEYEDIVIYYTVGVTHIPRVEDWPMMDSHHAGFMLMPAGFFSSNPGMGVPTTKGG